MAIKSVSRYHAWLELLSIIAPYMFVLQFNIPIVVVEANCSFLLLFCRAKKTNIIMKTTQNKQTNKKRFCRFFDFFVHFYNMAIILPRFLSLYKKKRHYCCLAQQTIFPRNNAQRGSSTRAFSLPCPIHSSCPSGHRRPHAVITIRLRCKHQAHANQYKINPNKTKHYNTIQSCR